MDYTYHKPYHAERQFLHDQIMHKYSHVEIDDGEYTCSVPESNWLVFTAGPMGSGKSRTLRHLQREGMFPLEAFVRADPDEIRTHIPEYQKYCLSNPNTAGVLTQKEVGYISEVLTLRALNEGKNALVDGSLRDTEWYDSYILKLKAKFPKLKVAILQVTASEENVFARAVKRAAVTGRVVPPDVILSTIRAIPASVAALKMHADYMAVFNNDHTPVLVESSTNNLSCDDFRDTWQMVCRPMDKRKGGFNLKI